MTPASLMAAALLAGPLHAGAAGEPPDASLDTDLAALALADAALEETGKAGDWQVALEGALVRAQRRAGGDAYEDGRATLDLRFDKMVAPGWRIVAANRLDLFKRRTEAGHHAVNTLKEAAVSWQVTPAAIVDLGRINVRQGVATGYNPTDYFKRNAVRAITSSDPDTLRRNRLGTVMLRGQVLWDSGSLSALYSPKLGKRPSGDPFDFDAGATNDSERWLVSASQKLGARLSPQWLLFKEEGGAPQLGMNLAALLSDAAVLNVEWSGGRAPTWQTDLSGVDLPARYANKAAVGVTYTTRGKLSLTFEAQYNGWAPEREAWARLREAAPATYTRYRTLLRDRLDLPSRRALFFYGTWEDAGLRHLDLTLMRRHNVDDGSGLAWLEGRYHWKHADLALQFQYNGGSARSEYGVLPDRRRWQLVSTFYF